MDLRIALLQLLVDKKGEMRRPDGYLHEEVALALDMQVERVWSLLEKFEAWGFVQLDWSRADARVYKIKLLPKGAQALPKSSDSAGKKREPVITKIVRHLLKQPGCQLVDPRASIVRTLSVAYNVTESAIQVAIADACKQDLLGRVAKRKVGTSELWLTRAGLNWAIEQGIVPRTETYRYRLRG